MCGAMVWSARARPPLPHLATSMPCTTGSQPLVFSAVAGPGLRYTKSRLIWMLSHSGSLGGRNHVTMRLVGSSVGSTLCTGYNFRVCKVPPAWLRVPSSLHLAGQARLMVPYVQGCWSGGEKLATLPVPESSAGLPE